MIWKLIESAPKNEWILIKSFIQKDIGCNDFIQESNEHNHFVFVARLEECFYPYWIINTNSCGCCSREIMPYEWSHIPK